MLLFGWQPCFIGSCKAHHVGISPQEDRGRAAGKVGEGTCGQEESGIAVLLSLALHCSKFNVGLSAPEDANASCRVLEMAKSV